MTNPEEEVPVNGGASQESRILNRLTVRVALNSCVSNFRCHRGDRDISPLLTLEMAKFAKISRPYIMVEAFFWRYNIHCFGSAEDSMGQMKRDVAYRGH